jgi:hypothetical protein
MQNQKIYWVVLFVPSVSNLVKSDHKNFSVSYEKLQTELESMFGVKNTSRFYCSSNKTYLDITQPSAIKDEYWQDFFSTIGKGISYGIHTTILGHMESSAMNYNVNFYKYCLNQEALSFVYCVAGLKHQSVAFYDSILYNNFENIEFSEPNAAEFESDFGISIDEFRNAMYSEKISKTALMNYIFHRQVEILKSLKNYEKISSIVTNYLLACKKVFYETTLPEVKA